MAEMPGPASQVLAIVDGSDDHRAAAIAGADLFSSTPGLQFTVLAPADVAQPSGAPARNGTTSTGNGLLLQRKQATAGLMETVRAVEDRGLTTKMRTVEGPFLDKAIDVAAAHDLVVLPASMADHAAEFPVPVIVAP